MTLLSHGGFQCDWISRSPRMYLKNYRDEPSSASLGQTLPLLRLLPTTLSSGMTRLCARSHSVSDEFGCSSETWCSFASWIVVCSSLVVCSFIEQVGYCSIPVPVSSCAHCSISSAVASPVDVFASGRGKSSSVTSNRVSQPFKQ